MTETHDALINVLRKRREYCRAMLELARDQQTLIDENRTTDLLQLIARKQQVLSGLSSLAQEFGGLPAFWKSVRETLPTEQRTECDAILQDSESLLAQALQAESLGTQTLAQRQDVTRGRLQELGELAQSQPDPASGGQIPEPQFLDVSR